MNQQDDKAYRQWIFKKNCSFSPKQVGLFYLAQSVFSLFVAGFFLLQGVWIVLPFTFLELTILAIALLIYSKHATDYEIIAIGRGILKIELCHAGKVEQLIWNPTWVQLQKILNDRKLIGLSYQGQEREIGRFLHVTARDKFLQDLKSQLRLVT